MNVVACYLTPGQRRSIADRIEDHLATAGANVAEQDVDDYNESVTYWSNILRALELPVHADELDEKYRR